MKIGLNLFSVYNLIQSEGELLKTVEILKDMGYSYFQYSGAAFEADRIKRVKDVTGVTFPLTHAPMERILGDTDNLMKDHEKFGCRNIGLGCLPHETFCDESKAKKTIDELEVIAKKMNERGFKFFYHNHFAEFMKFNGQTLFDYIIESAPHVNFTLDTYWLQYGGMNINEVIDKLNGRIDCVHLKDYKIIHYIKDGELDFKPVFAPLGDGVLDFKTIVKKMKASGTKYFFVEQDNAPLFENELELIKQSADYAAKEL